MHVSKLATQLAVEVEWERDDVFFKDLLAAMVAGVATDEADLLLYDPAVFDSMPDELRLAFAHEYDMIRRVKEELETGRLQLLLIDVSELNRFDVVDWWLEWRTNGIVFGKVLGKKKSYSFTLPLPVDVVVRFGDGYEHNKITIPRFEVAIDIISIQVAKSKKRVRRFWQWRGGIEVYFIVRLRNGKLYRKKIGEIKADWKGHARLIDEAKRKVKALKKRIRELEELRDKTLGSKRAVITRKINKLRKSLELWSKAKQRHYAARLQVWGQVGDVKIKKRVWFKRKHKDSVILKAMATTKKEVQILEFGNQKITVLSRHLVDGIKVNHVSVTGRRYAFYGKKGKLNHELRVLAIPQRKVKVQTLVQAREQVFRKFVKTRKHPVIVKELVADNAKVWLVEPVDGVSRVVLISKDHAKEGLDRVLIHLDNQVLIFEHRL